MNPWRLAWRNLQRNRTRTGIAAFAVALTTTLLVVAHGMTSGLEDLLTHNAIDLGVGEAQVHAKAYGLEQSIYETLPTADAIMASAKANGIDSAPRALGGGLVARQDKSSGARIWGVDPDAERALGALPRHLKEGTFLPAQNSNRIVLGCELARLLAVAVGEKIALIVQAQDGSTSTEMMTVTGIFAPVGEIDASVAVLDRRDFDALFLVNGKVHEVALSSHFRLAPERVAAVVTPAAGAAAEVKTWRVLLPSVADLVAVTRSISTVFTVVFLFVAGFGLLNTMLMSTAERIREFGVLKALGASSGRVIGGVTREAFLLGFVSASIGGLVGVMCTLVLARHGIDLAKVGKFELGGVGLEATWFARPSMRGVLMPTIGMMIVTILASLYPAVVTARLTPVKAMNHV